MRKDNKYFIRSSSFSKIMAYPDKDVFPKGGITTVQETVEKDVYQYTEELDTKEIQKGKLCEEDAIEFASQFLFLDLKKNTERNYTDYSTGETDVLPVVIDDKKIIIDIKCPWSKKTFPTTPEKGNKKEYEYQLRDYMAQNDCDEGWIVYCLMNTPESLCMYEDDSLHNVEYLPDELRITIVKYKRDLKIEERMEKRGLIFQEECEKHRNYLLNVKNKKDA